MQCVEKEGKQRVFASRIRITRPPSMAAPLSFFIIPIALLLDLHTYASSAGLVGLDTVLNFSYSGNTGPGRWGSLSPVYAPCAYGKWQSPIDIETDKVVVNKTLKPLKRHYYPSNTTLIDHGYNVGMQFENGGEFIVDGKKYTLLQMHWHVPSEHKIDGVLFASELHLVHKASDGSYTVIAVLYKIGDADPTVAKIQRKLGYLAKEVSARHEVVAQVDLGTFHIEKMRRKTHKYYKYGGSLTTPPCSENVIWHIFTKVRSMSKEQVEALRAPLQSTCKSNHRPVQPMHGRHVQLFI
ncbi:Alpha carbonic anhydrase [Actinidia chinensis var. chinensis]|uniref:Carbonic anhydrase n=1 Tax=Actinidia chinensis var. chinensis TaxID=1590841 RepID=A0A2R6QVY9_ACTCC|nr:Alpha carbonic anhydrase [Actinidia chinensis var. chinensis]